MLLCSVYVPNKDNKLTLWDKFRAVDYADFMYQVDMHAEFLKSFHNITDAFFTSKKVEYAEFMNSYNNN